MKQMIALFAVTCSLLLITTANADVLVVKSMTLVDTADAVSIPDKNGNYGITITTTPTIALQNEIRCPVRCYLVVHGVAQFDGIPSGSIVAGVVYIDGSISNSAISTSPSKPSVLPFSSFGIDDTATSGESNMRPFSLRIHGLSPGKHTLSLGLYTTAGTASSASQSWTVFVFQKSNEVRGR
jgi:hypothetical protein